MYQPHDSIFSSLTRLFHVLLVSKLFCHEIEYSIGMIILSLTALESYSFNYHDSQLNSRKFSHHDCKFSVANKLLITQFRSLIWKPNPQALLIRECKKSYHSSSGFKHERLLLFSFVTWPFSFGFGWLVLKTRCALFKVREI